MPGQTAYYGINILSKAKPGEVMYISAAAGAVGHLAVQFAKREGPKVIASAGSLQKVEFHKTLGPDHVFNYKVSDVNKELQAHGPINIYLTSLVVKLWRPLSQIVQWVLVYLSVVQLAPSTAALRIHMESRTCGLFIDIE